MHMAQNSVQSVARLNLAGACWLYAYGSEQCPVSGTSESDTEE